MSAVQKMTSTEQRIFRGVYAATVCPLRDDFSPDEVALATHCRAGSEVKGIRGLLVNGHAGENFSLDRQEQNKVLEVVRRTVNPEQTLIVGINHESSLEAALQAKDAAARGADALMVFPPNSWALSVAPETIIAHHQLILQATELPVFLYQAPVGSGAMAYSEAVILALVDMPQVVGIKEGSWEVARYEAHRRLVQQSAPHVAVMASGDEHLLTSFVLGTEGSIVSLAALIPEVVVALYEAVQSGELKTAQAAHEIVYPLARAIYGRDPASHATARLKTCLKLIGVLESDRVRPPLGKLDIDEVKALQKALGQAGL